MTPSISCVFLCSFVIAISNADDWYIKPHQVHLAIGDLPMSMMVTWVTFAPTNTSVVRYRSSTTKREVEGSSTVFIDGGEHKRQLFIHRVRLEDLIPEESYSYICGSEQAWSKEFTFRALPNGSDWSPRLAIFGDLGVINGRSLPELTRAVTKLDQFDAILHVGDFAYDMHTLDAFLGDIFMEAIEPIASRIPYMTAVGNHESAYNFSNYKNRFSMPGGDGESLFYSFNIGPVHVIAFSSEAYYYTNYGWEVVHNQYEWLKKDLEEANDIENRTLHPWIIAMAHRPMYCSNSVDAEHCDTVDNLIRTGFPLLNQTGHGYSLGPEDLFYEYGVDIIIGAHEHSYERFWPVYNRTVCNGTDSNPYHNPPAPVHFVTGSAGSSEGFDPFTPGGQPWSARRFDEYGFTRMHVHNATHITVEQMSVDRGPVAVVIDSFSIVKFHHGPGLYTCHRNQLASVQPWAKLQAVIPIPN